MYYFKEKSFYTLFIFLILALFIARPQLVYSQFDTDTEPPYVVQTSPQNGQTDVPVNSSIKVFFSESIDTVFLFNPFSIVPDIGGQIYWEQQDQTLIFSPDMLFNYFGF